MSDQNPAPESPEAAANEGSVAPTEATAASDASGAPETTPASSEAHVTSTSSEAATHEVATPAEVAPRADVTEPPALVEPTPQPPAETTTLPESVADTAVVEPAGASESEPVVATADPAAVETGAELAEDRVVYVEASRPPRKKGNRGVGSLIAVVATIVYAVLYAAAVLVIFPLLAPGESLMPEFMSFLVSTVFWVPVLFFLVFFILLVLLANRAGWWAYILGSNFIAVIVYFGSIGVFLLQYKVVLLTPAQAVRLFGQIASQPFVVTAGFLALELTIWAGAIIAVRGRRVKARNVEAREAYEREASEIRPERDAAGFPVS